VKRAAPFRVRPDGILLIVRLTPRASRDGIDGLKSGLDGTYIQARVRAVPEDGRANAALAQLVADQLRVPKSTVTIASGNTARLKTLHIAGDATELETRVTAWLKGIA
jgi:uncharacterized protein (TIGR00251 family)